jgi:SpoVK/Ycf46/Vps4 family AAA+-type ATPase
VSGTELVFDLQRTIEQAREHAPAVIFLDDCDALFESDTHYRAFRTSLDGLEARQPLCFVITCMNLKSIPAALLRGGRLELTLITRLPTLPHLQSMLIARLQHILTVLPTAADQLVPILEIEFIGTVARAMAGWNYADVKRATDDVLRMLADNSPLTVPAMFQRCIVAVRQQYDLSSPTASTNLDDTATHNYIS